MLFWKLFTVSIFTYVSFSLQKVFSLSAFTDRFATLRQSIRYYKQKDHSKGCRSCRWGRVLCYCQIFHIIRWKYMWTISGRNWLTKDCIRHTGQKYFSSVLTGWFGKWLASIFNVRGAEVTKTRRKSLISGHFSVYWQKQTTIFSACVVYSKTS